MGLPLRPINNTFNVGSTLDAAIILIVGPVVDFSTVCSLLILPRPLALLAPLLVYNSLIYI